MCVLFLQHIIHREQTEKYLDVLPCIYWAKLGPGKCLAKGSVELRYYSQVTLATSTHLPLTR